jgi:hypothetical protein
MRLTTTIAITLFVLAGGIGTADFEHKLDQARREDKHLQDLFRVLNVWTREKTLLWSIPCVSR